MNSSAYDIMYQFTGRRFDDNTGLHYYRNRFYESRHGRFIGRDFLKYLGSMNGYDYTRNKVINQIDPSGMIDVSITVTPVWRKWKKVKKITIGGVSRTGVKGRTTIGSNIAVFLDKDRVKQQANVLITNVTCRIISDGCPKRCVRAVQKSIRILVRPLIEYLRGDRSTAIHEATHAQQIGDKIGSKVRSVQHSTRCSKNTAQLLRICAKQVASKARTRIAEAIREWNTESDSIHALEAGKNDKNPDKKYKQSEVETEARKQAATGEFPEGITLPGEFR